MLKIKLIEGNIGMEMYIFAEKTFSTITNLLPLLLIVIKSMCLHIKYTLESHMHQHMQTYTQTHAHAHIHSHTHIYTHTHTHTHILT